ncbi:hypothetical protein [Xenorhabdus cabanillasii]|uniref:Uncharacterized protein n=1 Tax=Xenorhabdus cabanillasii JM26 TaxID=1427517 RepID=W1JAF9_9GAMM|nr:hypothetical protein [Xenorhabdus cabanillasii]PHM75419.1 hypothetical protein Xcab_04102 [Xenorhabdus cabanillasii JM26]CDL86465.1 conserved exported hypothetical protein [Xenorhabdus cabanillasii JM26]
MKIISCMILALLSFLLTPSLFAVEKNDNIEKKPVFSAEYNMELKNSSFSENSLMMVKRSTECMYDSGQDQINIAPGNQQSAYLKDNDNLFSGCTRETKSVEWSVYGGSISCTLSFEHGYDSGWYTVIKGCPNIVKSAICNGDSNCNQIRVYGGEPNIDINIEFLVR